MGIYTPPDIDVDRDAIYQAVVDDLKTAIPGLDVAPGTLIDRLVRAITARHAEQLELLAERAQGEYEAYGENVLRVAKLQPSKASAVVTINAIDTLGHTLPAGAQVSLATGTGDREMFETAADAVIAASSSAITGVTVTAVNAGADPNGLYLDPVLEQPLAWAATPVVTTAAAGGSDGETSDEYVARLSDVTQLLGTTLTIPSKFALAGQTLAGVTTALAIDLYKPGPPWDGTAADPAAEGHITIVVRGEDGLAIDTGDRTAAQAFYDANTVSFIHPWVIDPTPTTITVVFAAKAEAAFDPAEVEASAEQAVLDFLSPARWGLAPYGDQRVWIDKPKVRFQDISTVLNNVQGLDYWTSLTINGGTADITMSGPGAVPAAAPTSTASGTVT